MRSKCTNNRLLIKLVKYATHIIQLVPFYGFDSVVKLIFCHFPIDLGAFFVFWSIFCKVFFGKD